MDEGGFGPLGQWLLCVPTLHITYGMLPLAHSVIRHMSVELVGIG